MEAAAVLLQVSLNAVYQGADSRSTLLLASTKGQDFHEQPWKNYPRFCPLKKKKNTTKYVIS